MRQRTQRLSILFNGSRVIITVGSLIIPALLSVEGSCISPTIYWSTWGLSLCVTICNAFISLFKLDKSYYYLNTVMEHLVSEGWQYIELTGKYSGFHTPGVRATHENQFVFFCHAYEKIRMKQVQEEYYKLTETQTNTQGHTSNGGRRNSLIPPTPQQGQLAAIPPDIVQLVKRNSQPVVDGSNTEKGSEGQDEEDKTQEDQENWAPSPMPVHINVSQ